MARAVTETCSICGVQGAERAFLRKHRCKLIWCVTCGKDIVAATRLRHYASDPLHLDLQAIPRFHQLQVTATDATLGVDLLSPAAVSPIAVPVSENVAPVEIVAADSPAAVAFSPWSAAVQLFSKHQQTFATTNAWLDFVRACLQHNIAADQLPANMHTAIHLQNLRISSANPWHTLHVQFELHLLLA